ncbi:MAG: hypothetical protein IJR26_04885 [Bacteroidales bacterium]|nr:hypothetical protein [Bacteroidales bacterium]
MFEFIKNKLQQRQLRNLLNKQRDKRIDNWEDIKTIGLIFTVGDAEHWNLLHRFVSAQENRGKEVHLIGFQADNYEINYIFSHTKTVICHEKTDFNRLGLPKEGVIDSFVDKHYDLLIDATSQPDFFGRYVTAMAEANLKVGFQNNSLPDGDNDRLMYDMLIQGDDEMDLRNYIEQIVKYLLMVKK